MHIQNVIKIHPTVLKILRKNTFLHQSRAIALLFINKFSPNAIPNYTSAISMSMQSLKKIGQKLLELETGNEAPTDGRTDRHSKRFGGYTVMILRFRTDMPGQTVKTQIRLQSDQGLHCLPFRLHHLDSLLYTRGT